MSLGLLGNKIGMTQIFDESGNIIPVTIVKVGPCIITQIKTTLTDGYNAIQIGYGTVSNKSLTQPELGHLQKSNIQPLKYLKEFRVNDPDETPWNCSDRLAPRNLFLQFLVEYNEHRYRFPIQYA